MYGSYGHLLYSQQSALRIHKIYQFQFKKKEAGIVSLRCIFVCLCVLVGGALFTNVEMIYSESLATNLTEASPRLAQDRIDFLSTNLTRQQDCKGFMIPLQIQRAALERERTFGNFEAKGKERKIQFIGNFSMDVATQPAAACAGVLA